METNTTTKEKTKLPAFKGRHLIKFIPQPGFLEGDFGKAFFEEYNKRVETDYNKNPNLDVLRYDDVVKGSNPFAVVLANKILREENLRTATQADLEKALKIGWDLRETYEDTGLVLRNEEDKDYSRNTPLAKEIGSQVKERGIKFSPKIPVIIPLTGFELKKADNDYGLTFRLREDAEVYETPILNKAGSFDSEDIDEKTGLPNKIKDSGSRTLYVRDSGFSRLLLNDGLDCDSDFMDLVSSGDDGRIVVISAKGTAPEKLKTDLMDKIYREYQAQLEELNAKRAEAEKAALKIMGRKK